MKKSNRQIHETKGSFYIYLPKEWIKKYSIVKNQELAMVEFFDGSIILKNNSNPESGVNKSVKISLDSIGDNINLMKSHILAAYIIGAEEITIESSSRISAEKREEIITQIRMLSGFEIINETKNMLQTREIGKLSDISSILTTLFSTTLIMLRSLIDSNTIEDSDEAISEFKGIISRDDDVNRYRYMIDRQSHLILSNLTLGVDLKISPIATLHLSNIAKNIERIGDHCSELSTIFQNKSKRRVKIFTKFKGLFDEILDSYEQLSEIYRKGDYGETFDLLEYLKALENKIRDEINSSGSTNSLILYHFGRIVGYSVNIAEITIDQIAFDELYADE